MYQFIETIAIERGEAELLALHQARLDKTFATHYPGAKPHQLSEWISLDHDTLTKCRVLYNAVEITVEYTTYQLPTIHSLQTVKTNAIDYSSKYFDRSELEALYALKGTCDDILIVKDGFVTDSYFANCAFFDGQNWLTPDTNLLGGVRRQHLINSGLITPAKISLEDIKHFQSVSLINAMIDLGVVNIGIDDIHY